MTYRFYKNEVGQWFIDLPEYIKEGGKKANLQMVEGADQMLELLAEGKEEVSVTIGTSNFGETITPSPNNHLLIRKEVHTGDKTGASYRAEMDFSTDHYKEYEMFGVWLCDVTKYVFGDFPEVIHVKRAND